MIFEYLDSGNINAAYEGVKLARDKEIRSIMGLLKSDYRDKGEYLSEEIFCMRWRTYPRI